MYALLQLHAPSRKWFVKKICVTYLIFYFFIYFLIYMFTFLPGQPYVTETVSIYIYYIFIYTNNIMHTCIYGTA